MAHFQAIIIYFFLKEIQRSLVFQFFLKQPTAPPSGLCETEISLSSTLVVPRNYFLCRDLQH